MADEADRANDQASEMLDRAIASARQYKQAAPATGSCLECGEDLPLDRRWCSADCRDQWQLRQQFSR